MPKDPQHAFEQKIIELGYRYTGTETGEDGVLRKVWKAKKLNGKPQRMTSREDFSSPDTAKRYLMRMRMSR